MASIDQIVAAQEVLDLDCYQLSVALGLPQSLLKYPELEPILSLGLALRRRQADHLVELADLLYSQFPNHGRSWLRHPNPLLKEQHSSCPPYRALVTLGVDSVLRAAYIDYDTTFASQVGFYMTRPSMFAGQ